MSKILLVDDEPKVLRALSAAFESTHEIQTSESASEAKQLLLGQGPFDAVISDEIMPEIKGHELLNWCIENSPNVKRIMLTGLPITDKLKQKLEKVDEVNIFTKPWNIEDIKGALPSIDPSSETEVDGQNSNKVESAENELLIVETSSKYKELYSELAQQYPISPVYLKTPIGLMNLEASEDQSQKIIIDVQNGQQSYSTIIKELCKRHSNIQVIITAESSVAREMGDLGERFKQVTILVKPFSIARLASHLKIN